MPTPATGAEVPLGGYPNRQLVVYALFLLGGDTQRQHTEDVALKCYELFPTSFSWVKHPQYPDKDIVRVALTDARKMQHGALVTGRAGQKRGLYAKTKRGPVDDGWLLTAAGIRWVQENRDQLERRSGARQSKDHRLLVLKQLKRLREHPLFAEYKRSGANFTPSIGDLADMLRCRVDADEVVWLKRFGQVRQQAQAATQTDILEFIALCESGYLAQR